MNVGELRQQLEGLDADQRVEIEDPKCVLFPIDSVVECSWIDHETGKPVVLIQITE